MIAEIAALACAIAIAVSASMRPRSYDRGNPKKYVLEMLADWLQ